MAKQGLATQRVGEEDREKNGEKDVEIRNGTAAAPRRLASRRRYSSSTSKSSNLAPLPKVDCERACAAFKECGAFDVISRKETRNYKKVYEIDVESFHVILFVI